MKKRKMIILAIMIILLIAAIIIGITMTNAAGNTAAPETEQTFTEEGDGYYIWVRAVDHAGNKGPWSEAQRVWIETGLPTITIKTNSNTTWAQTGSVTVALQDSKSGLAEGASVKYGWSESLDTEPSSYTTASLSYTAGTKEEVTFTAEASGLTGKYYLWVVPTTLADTAGNTQTTTAKSTGQFYFDNTGPSAPAITGGSTTYATSRTISVSTASTDTGVGTVPKYEYYYSSSSTAPTASTTATGTASTTTTSQKFASNMKAYYVYFRGVDSLGNKGTWSSAQRLYIDINSPTVSANNSSVTITEGDSVAMSTYFTTSASGNAAISSTVYKIGSASYTNTSSLAAGTYTVTCTVTKVTGFTASASMTLTVQAKVTLPEEETELLRFGVVSNSSTEESATFTVPDGVSVIRVTCVVQIVGGYMDEGSIIARNGDTTWVTVETIQSTNIPNAGRVFKHTGVSYVKVTPGKTYNFVCAGNIVIVYSRSINEETPDVVDL